jgi:hypothetical protein
MALTIPARGQHPRRGAIVCSYFPGCMHRVGSDQSTTSCFTPALLLHAQSPNINAAKLSYSGRANNPCRISKRSHGLDTVLTSTPESGIPSHTPFAQRLNSGRQSTRRRDGVDCTSPEAYSSLRKLSHRLRTISETPLSRRYLPSAEDSCWRVCVRSSMR